MTALAAMLGRIHATILHPLGFGDTRLTDVAGNAIAKALA